MTPDEILTFWFEGDATVRREKWFKKDADFDTACARFIPAIRAARTGAFDSWAGTAQGAVALIVLLDQLSRNVFRGSAEAFAADPHARAIARDLIARGDDKDLTPFERQFVYLPFEHGESMEDQTESVRLFEDLRGALGDSTVEYAHKHRAVIEKFGRFPHRNAALGRIDTAGEAAYLAEPGSGF